MKQQKKIIEHETPVIDTVEVNGVQNSSFETLKMGSLKDSLEHAVGRLSKKAKKKRQLEGGALNFQKRKKPIQGVVT